MVSVKFNIDVDALRLMPIYGHIYWKNREGLYLGGNDLILESNNISSYQDFLTRTDYELPAEEAALYRREDLLVMKSGKPMQFYSLATFPHCKFEYLTLKIPLLDQDRKLHGIFGFSQIISELNVNETFSYLAEAGVPLKNLESTSSILKKNYYAVHEMIKQQKKYSLTNFIKIDNAVLSARESECLHLTVRGKTAKEIADTLKLSKRTIECYLENIKNKLKVNSKSELIDKVLNHFINC